MALAIGAGHQGGHGPRHLLQAVVRIAPALEGLLLQVAAQALLVAIHGQGLARKDLDLVVLFLGFFGSWMTCRLKPDSALG